MEQLIVNTSLPVTQNFKLLKEEALAFVQEFGGNSWTNLNTSDPGVTIIDQLCYALTELGYCNDFSISDILTLPDGKLLLENQFYLPEDILTSAPVNFNDYRKYLIDSVQTLKNVMFYAVSSTFYQAYLSPKNNLVSSSDLENETFYTLNKSRNINELFLKPQVLKIVTKVLNGKLEIDKENELSSIIIAINTAIDEYIFPSVKQMGYDTLVHEGLDTDEIFNGPLLQHGWITTDDLGKQLDEIAVNEISDLMFHIKGVKKVSSLSFADDDHPFPLKQSELLKVDLSGLQITCNGKTLNSNAIVLTKTKRAEMSVVLGAAVKIQTDLPLGKFRDVSSFYSIQNTFPEIFAVGESAITSNATNFQIAQSRQLKGYLTLFDQVLANQFSQLANVGQLFSFKNSMNGNPSDVNEYDAVKDSYQKKHSTSPVPYLRFSPTYYFQSLYQTPNIRPLLKDNDMFKLMEIDETDKELENENWIAYKENSYNPYIRGLMDFMQDETIDLTRRNNILNHLLARHGESPSLIDTIIEGSVYTGNQLKGNVIIKSLYLQNFGLLSYYRQKAYNFLAAHPLSPLFDNEILNFGDDFYDNDTLDFVFLADKVDEAERLNPIDFINYSAIELKLHLLFGLKMQYKNHLVASYESEIDGSAIRLALWMIQKRKGFLFIEMNLLFKDLTYEVSLKIDQNYWIVQDELSYQNILAVHDFLNKSEKIDLIVYNGETILQIADLNLKLKPKLVEIPFLISDKNAIYGVKVNNSVEFLISQFDLIFGNRVLLIFPQFLESNSFINRVETFLDHNLPLANTYSYLFEQDENLIPLVSAFVSWHNSLIFDGKDNSQLIQESATRLAKVVLSLNNSSK